MKSILALLTLALSAVVGALPARASDDAPLVPQLVLPWYDGVFQNIGYDYACASDPPILEIRTQAYAGYTLRPPNMTPAVGEIFYAHLVLSHPGYPCGGSIIGVGLMLPQGVSTAVSAANPAFCFGRAASGTLYDLGNDSGYGCPQTFAQGLEGSLALIPPRGGAIVNGQKSYAWGANRGFWLEFMVPLVASAPQFGNTNVQWRVNPDIGVVGYPKVPLLVNNDVLFRTSNEDNQLVISI